MSTSCDVVVVGLGAMGSATALHLARTGAKVIGIDSSTPPNADGSSHGETRITRLAVGEGSSYVPLVQRSHELWRQYEAELSTELFVECGGLILGDLESTGQHGVPNFVAATIEMARSNSIAHEILETREITDRFPAFQVTDEVGYYEPTAGYLLAAQCVRAQMALAMRAGAAVRLSEPIVQWSASGSGVHVETARDQIDAGVMVLAAGPWLPELAPELAGLLSVQRQVQYWFDVEHEASRFEQLPVFIWMHGSGDGEYMYGFPAMDGPDGGIKLATEEFGDATTPGDVDRHALAAEAVSMHADHVSGRIPGVSSRCLRSAVCLYTVTPDFGFIVDRHPEHEQVIVASPCSGHGFKHSAAIGESIAQLALTGSSRIDLSTFGFDRFDRQSHSPTVDGALCVRRQRRVSTLRR